MVTADWKVLTTSGYPDGCHVLCESLETGDTIVFSVSKRTANGREFLDHAVEGATVNAVLSIVPRSPLTAGQRDT